MYSVNTVSVSRQAVPLPIATVWHLKHIGTLNKIVSLEVVVPFTQIFCNRNLIICLGIYKYLPVFQHHFFKFINISKAIVSKILNSRIQYFTLFLQNKKAKILTVCHLLLLLTR